MSEDNNVTYEEISGKALEEELLKQAEAKADDAFGTAATAYGMYIKAFRNGVEGLSNKQLKRLILAMLEVPLWEKVPNLKTKVERELFAIGDFLLTAKATMIMKSFMDAQQAVEDAKTQTQENVNDGTEKKEE